MSIEDQPKNLGITMEMDIPAELDAKIEEFIKSRGVMKKDYFESAPTLLDWMIK